MANICLFDPSYENSSKDLSSNLGDLIIQESVLRELRNLFPGCKIINIPTHSKIRWRDAGKILFSRFRFVGGTNLLSSRMDEYNQWKINMLDISMMQRNVILMGVGWWQYQEPPNYYTKYLLKMILSGKYLHSVRDQYTLEKLKNIGIRNVINTGCPTMWDLPNYNSIIPYGAAESVLTMLTDYKKDRELDVSLLRLLKDNYRKVYFWPQGRQDLTYLKELNAIVAVELLEHSLHSLDTFLSSGVRVDYVGTRLHGGIRCLKKGIRSLILAIDNRATEISVDTNLPVLDRSNINAIKKWILTPNPTRIFINSEAVLQWKDQFL